MPEWSKGEDLRSSILRYAWVRTPHPLFIYFFYHYYLIMEEKGKEIKEIIFKTDIIEITYETDIIEIINKDCNGYKKLYELWLIEQPVFISDIYKIQMRDLYLASRNKELSINELNNFLSEENRNEAIKFINYMRKRDLSEERKKWTKK